MSAGLDQHKEKYHGKYRHIQKVRGQQLYRRNRHDELAEEERHHRRRRTKRKRKRPDAPRVCGKSGNRSRLGRSEEHTSELQSLMRISYAVFCLKKKKT